LYEDEGNKEKLQYVRVCKFRCEYKRKYRMEMYELPDIIVFTHIS